MQSGITASKELQEAFNDLVSSFTAQRGIVAGIESEQLVPIEIIPSKSADFFEDLNALDSLVKDDEAAYIILRRYQNAPNGFVAVTYVPDHAPVRSKMLFASTRLTLVRELGIERFRETIFATTKQELTTDGWRKHDKHGELKAPLTEEELALQEVKDAEAEASRGTTARSSHVSSGLSFPIATDALDALRKLSHGADNLIQLKINISKETIELASKSSVTAEELAGRISDSEPRYSFFRYSHIFEGQEEAPTVFVYTCPTGSNVKERMLYASSRAGVVSMAASECALQVAKKLEASNPSEITSAVLEEELHPKKEQKQGFSRPKRPGKR